jgi:hypothetical protein
MNIRYFSAQGAENKNISPDLFNDPNDRITA